MEFLYELYTDSCALAGGECDACLMEHICLPMGQLIYPAHIISKYTLSTCLSRVSFILKNFPSVVDFVNAGIKL